MDNFQSWNEGIKSEVAPDVSAKEGASQAFRDDLFSKPNDLASERKEASSEKHTDEQLTKSAEKIVDTIPKLWVFDGGPGTESQSMKARKEIIVELKSAESTDQLSLLVAKANLMMAEKGETNYLRIMSTPMQSPAPGEPAYFNQYEVQLAPTWKYGSLLTDFVFDGKKSSRPNV